MFKPLKKIIEKYRKKRNYRILKKCFKNEFEDMIFYSAEERKLLTKPIFTMSKREYRDFLMLTEIGKASAYAEALHIIKNR